MSLEDLIEDMPPKRIADRLVSRCLNSRYPALSKHLPPTEVYAFLAYAYSCDSFAHISERGSFFFFHL